MEFATGTPGFETRGDIFHGFLISLNNIAGIFDN
jgi:hypothetical protein